MLLTGPSLYRSNKIPVAVQEAAAQGVSPQDMVSLDFVRNEYWRYGVRGSFATLPGNSVTRASPAWGYVDGIFTEFADNEAAITDNGLEVLRGATNLVLHSDNLTAAAWTVFQSTVAADADGVADEVTTTGVSGGIYQTITVTPGETYTWQFRVKLNGLPPADFLFAVYDESASAWIEVDIAPSVQPNDTDYTLVSYTFDAPAGCTQVRVYPYRPGKSVTGSVFIKNCQCEEGTTATGYVPTTTTTSSRAQQDVEVALTSGALDPSLPFHVYCEVAPVGDQEPAAFPLLFVVDDGTYDKVLGVFYSTSSGNFAGLRRTPAQTTQTASGALGSLEKFVLNVEAGSWKVARNGAVTGGLSASIPAGLTRLCIGFAATGARGNWHFKRIYAAAGTLSDAQMQSITSL